MPIRDGALWLSMVLAAVLPWGCSGRDAGGPTRISIHDLREVTQKDESALVIDVRGTDEYRALHVPPVKRVIPHTLLPESLSTLPPDKDTAIYLICRTDRRSGLAGQLLWDNGYRAVYVVEGGTSAWARAGLPTDSGAGVLAPPSPPPDEVDSP